MSTPSRTPQERLWSSTGHATILLLTLLFPMSLALVVPLLVYLYVRRRSRWLAFQTLQALLYQIIVYFVLLALLYLIPRTSTADGSKVPAVWGLTLAIAFAYGLVGALRCYRGRNFRYPLLGAWLERRMAPLDD